MKNLDGLFLGSQTFSKSTISWDARPFLLSSFQLSSSNNLTVSVSSPDSVSRLPPCLQPEFKCLASLPFTRGYCGSSGLLLNRSFIQSTTGLKQTFTRRHWYNYPKLIAIWTHTKPCSVGHSDSLLASPYSLSSSSPTTSSKLKIKSYLITPLCPWLHKITAKVTCCA